VSAAYSEEPGSTSAGKATGREKKNMVSSRAEKSSSSSRELLSGSKEEGKGKNQTCPPRLGGKKKGDVLQVTNQQGSQKTRTSAPLRLKPRGRREKNLDAPQLGGKNRS